ncbi:VOC family protein [Paenibacillus sp. KQZ6P-2]|uniref:Bleomycin resistance protein n=1 Tax=Paenibacillus mangrovi TaxID=2931978 RepID=A0A9X1WMY5_9BACL|nr:glyoxalase superfamily protein [Paenibacillus mangrovi]MCJ8010795.1 VOC family protein [Paenibacillus mangrovi]
MRIGNITPIFRIFDENKAKEFYLEYLGFHLDWEHRFEKNMPLYMQVSKPNLTLHLTEHYGDCSPGSAIRIATTELEDFHRSLLDKGYRYSRPGIEKTEWNTKEVCLIDPFGNKLFFYEEITEN